MQTETMLSVRNQVHFPPEKYTHTTSSSQMLQDHFSVINFD